MATVVVQVKRIPELKGEKNYSKSFTVSGNEADVDTLVNRYHTLTQRLAETKGDSLKMVHYKKGGELE